MTLCSARVPFVARLFSQVGCGASQYSCFGSNDFCYPYDCGTYCSTTPCGSDTAGEIVSETNDPCSEEAGACVADATCLGVIA